jgi:hypothetical protein
MEDLLIDKDVSVAGFTRFQVQDNLVGILHGPLLYPRLDLLVCRELKHLPNGVRAANEGATNRLVAVDQGEGVDGRQFVVRDTDQDETPILPSRG